MKKSHITSSKALIYIDSNIYLRFYDSNQSNFKQLLKTLIQLKDSIFITRQIVDEVTRNKAQIFERTFTTYIKQASGPLNNVQLPEHLDVEEDNKLKEWNKNRAIIKTSNEKLINELKSIYKETARNILLSKDEVSNTLNNIFINQIVETDLQYKRAEKRKKIGNPPGKNNDSLGDQINWEQLLSAIPNVDTVYIVSNDFDYFIEVGDECHLNPFLHNEITNINPSINIVCFNRLSHALKSLSQHKETKAFLIPNPGIIDKIEIEEFTSDLNSNVAPYFSGTTFYADINYKLMDTIQRLNYMYSHAMLSKYELAGRLSGLGVNSEKINDIISRGYIRPEDYFSFRDYIFGQ